MANLRKTPVAGEATALKAANEVTEYGSIQISEDVIAAVVRRYTLSVPGIARLAGQTLVGGLAQMIGKRMHDRSIIVDFESNHVNITVTIVIKFGEHVPSVAATVQNICRKYVEELTGQRVGKVNVIVQGLEVEGEESQYEERSLLENSEQNH